MGLATSSTGTLTRATLGTSNPSRSRRRRRRPRPRRKPRRHHPPTSPPRPLRTSSDTRLGPRISFSMAT
eukprot:4114152-Pyramimonas_sp.AAC.1